MKTIILFRHGQTKQEIASKSDHDRALASKGIEEAERMGLYLARKHTIPDIVISSTAVRAKTTAELAIVSGKWECTFKLESGIYGGDPIFLLNLVKYQVHSLNP